MKKVLIAFSSLALMFAFSSCATTGSCCGKCGASAAKCCGKCGGGECCGKCGGGGGECCGKCKS